MIAFLQWVLVVLGCAYFVTESVIFAPVRTRLARGSFFRATLFYCPACTGFWVGVASGFLQPDLWVNPVQSGIAAMALGSIWAKFVTSSPFLTELPQLGIEIEDSNDTQAEAKNV